MFNQQKIVIATILVVSVFCIKSTIGQQQIQQHEVPLRLAELFRPPNRVAARPEQEAQQQLSPDAIRFRDDEQPNGEAAMIPSGVQNVVSQEQAPALSDVADIIANRGSFLTIVTPDPIDESSGSTPIPQTLFVNGIECFCIPYNYCYPNETIRPDAPIDFGTINVQYNPDSCAGVLDRCCRRENRLTQPIQPPPLAVTQPNRPRGCGIRNVGGIDFKLINNVNYESGFGEFPWTVAIIRINDGVCHCGGSLIHPQVILTGAHCVKTFTPNQLKVRAGEWDTQTTKERLPYQEKLVTRIITHQEYSHKTLANDMALVIMDSPVTLDDHINVVCLPRQKEVSTSQECFASGWGRENFGREGKWSVILKRIPLPIVPSQTCEQALRQTRLTNKFMLHSSFICAGGQAGIDTCQGDGGAPLVCPIGPASDNRYIQAGTVAWGIGCKQSLPAVYGNVAVFRDWIDGNMLQLGFDTNSYTY